MKKLFLIIILFLTPSIAFAETPAEYKVQNEDVQVRGALSSLDKIEYALKGLGYPKSGIS
jgi:hypothetical protein